MSPESELYLQALWITPFVRKWLERSSHPRIHSLFRQSCNLINEDDGLISLVLPLVGPGPFAMVVDGDMRNFERVFSLESQVVADTQNMQLGEWIISLAEAVEWNPRPAWGTIRERTAQLKQQLGTVTAMLAAQAPPGSFAPLALRSTVESDAVQMLAVQAAKEPVAMLWEGISGSNETAIREGAARLAGLGGGVTPSGDDFLMGVMLAMWAITDDERASMLGDWVKESARERTNLISNAWLAAAASGEASIEWHQFFEALAVPGESGLHPIVNALIQRGHTSGADAMAGFVAAAELLLA